LDQNTSEPSVVDSKDQSKPQIEETPEKPVHVTKLQETVAINGTPNDSESLNANRDSAVHNANTSSPSHGLNPLAAEWQPPSTKGDVQLIAEALTASVGLSRLPVPEPPIFTGDPMTYADWRASFAALIESRGIPSQERIHYLRRYVGGPAKEMVSGYFLLKGEDAFDKAKKALEDRYGDPFIVSEAFRDKLESWPRISPKDSIGLRRYADFLAQCEVAMAEIKGLEILNDCRENQKMLQRLPDWLVTRWGRIVSKTRADNQRYPSFSVFAKFVTDEAKIVCDPIASVGALKQDKVKAADQKERPHGTAKTLLTEANVRKCSFCERENHSLPDCRVFEKKPLPQRHQYVKLQGLCYRCLERGHQARNCVRRSTCKRCKGKHPTSLHEEKRQTNEAAAVEKAVYKEKRSDPKASSEDLNPEIKSARCDGVSSDSKEEMSSMVVPVWISSTEHPEQERLVYALLDTQSDTTFVLQQTAELLETHREPVQLRLTTMTSKDGVVQCCRFKNLVVRGFKSDIRIKLPVTYSREYIPADESHIPTPETARKWPHLSEVAHYLQPLLNCEVGLLIGYNCAQALAPRRCITGEGNQPFAVETDLGWSVVGRSEYEDFGDAIGLSHRVVTKLVPKDVQLSDGHQEVKFACKMPVKEEIIKPVDIVRILESDFSEMHEKEVTMSLDDIRFMKIVEEGIYKENGHYVMPLPFKGTRPRLPNNKIMASRRLDNLKRRFLNDPKYFTEYKGFIEDILLHGDAEIIQKEGHSTEGEIWYIPHHGIYHPKKPDKIRVVFDCSAKYKGVSLNDHLLQGPDLINSLVGVLCRFRQRPTAIMCDIERMFHQFQVHPDDRDYLRFLWWDKGDLNTEPSEYRMKVHLFGAVSSPGCANYGLKRVARDNPLFGPEAANFVAQNFYVDDGLTSVNGTADAVSLINNARSMCAEGGLRLHKFASNDRAVMDSVPSSERAANLKTLDLSIENLPVERALGIQWCIESDDFQFRLTLKDQPLTRRGILSTVSSVFDPLGLIAPVILRGKQILQELCQNNVDWDEPVPETQRVMWEKWRLELPELASLKIERCFTPTGFGKVDRIELHHFSDASMKGYGQCSYVRLVNGDRIHCSLAMAKARVAPLKPTTVPRLELQAAVTSAQISMVLDRELEYQDMEHHYWTDSKVVLGYINNDARRFHIFVSNRVQKIRNISSPEQWRYVDTLENPADHASRGLGARELTTSSWFTGPSFLWENNVTTTESDKFIVSPDDPEVKNAQVLVTKSLEDSSIIRRLERFSSWSRAVKALTVLRRYIHQKRRRVIEDGVMERASTEEAIIKMVQRQAFPEDIDSLSKDKPVRTSGLQKLDPFMDSQGMLRVGGRLQESSLPYSIKHPLILPRKNHVVNLIIQHCHEQVAHQGRGMTTNKLRENGYWVMGCSTAVSSVVYKCVECRRLRGKSQEQKMANLPEERLECSPPFTYCGMDCFGPFYVKEGRKELKRYGLLFTCLALRAIHIEVIDDMSTDSFLNGLRCCIAIRGQIRMIRCDQGSNFIGAKHELQNAMKEIDSERVAAVLLEHNCDFKMNPPSASHMGGIWERQIRTIRNVLSGLLAEYSRQLDSSSLRTLMYEVMAIINSRPLSVDSLNEPGAPLPLTPNHLLTMKASVIMPPPGEFPKEDLYLKKRWRRVQYLANQFWTRWKKEYLHNLQIRQKWQTRKPNIKTGDIVILCEEDKPRSDWRLARVIETVQSTEGLVRRVKVLVGEPQLSDEGKRITKPLILERPIHKLILLVD